MSIGLPSVAARPGGIPCLKLVAADYRTADEPRRLRESVPAPARGPDQRPACAPASAFTAAGGIISDTFPPNEAISLTSDEET